MTYTPKPEDLAELPMPEDWSAAADRVLGPTREALEEAGLDPADPSSPFVHRMLYGTGVEPDPPLGLVGSMYRPDAFASPLASLRAIIAADVGAGTKTDGYVVSAADYQQWKREVDPYTYRDVAATPGEPRIWGVRIRVVAD